MTMRSRRNLTPDKLPQHETVPLFAACDWPTAAFTELGVELFA